MMGSLHSTGSLEGRRKGVKVKDGGGREGGRKGAKQGGREGGRE